MDKQQIMKYLTVENVMFFLGALIVFSILAFMLKQFFKMMSFAMVLLVAYYFFLAPPSFKSKVNTCVKSSIDKKEISPICKRIFK